MNDLAIGEIRELEEEFESPNGPVMCNVYVERHDDFSFVSYSHIWQGDFSLPLHSPETFYDEAGNHILVNDEETASIILDKRTYAECLAWAESNGF